MKAALALALLAVSAVARAHPLDVGALQLAQHGTEVNGTLDLSQAMARTLLGLGEGAEIPLAQVAAPSLGGGLLTVGGASCTLSFATPAPINERLSLPYTGHCEKTGELRWDFPFIEKLPLSFRLLIAADRGNGNEEFILGSGHTALTLTSTEPEHTFGQFVYMGMQHIGATPSEWFGPQGFHLPDGIDHILFLVALLLTGVALMPVLKTVTGFTLGHSVTLSLATLGIVQLPSRIVESAIALSIAYVAAEDFWLKSQKSRWQIAALFGLVHGFGFALALAELHLPRQRLASALFGFNLGVEIGQEIIVLALAPILWALFKWPWFERIGRKVCAGGVLLCALVWFYRRAFGG